MGFNMLAFLAGAQPKMMPIATEKPTPSDIASLENPKSIPIALQAANDNEIPSIRPIIPPRTERNIDSIRN
jgi:hypothetical protein